jgi:HAE1 family hydrophobic/amphiphilic exporter-1
MKRLAEICIQRPVFATMLVVALLVTGMASYQKLGVDLFPKVEFPFVIITTTLRGAAPEEVETQVTKRIEEAVNTISGIDDLRSISAEGVSVVTIQFVLEKDAEVAAQEVRDKVSAVQKQLPRDVDPPVVEKIATDASPVINVVISSSRDLRETTKIVDDRIKKNIESLNGVGQVRFVGERVRQIQIHLDPGALFSHNLNIDQVRAAIAAQNVETPGGRVDQGPKELSLRTLGRVETPRDFNRLVVATSGTAPVRISDIATVEDGAAEARSLARLDGVAAVVLEIRKQSGTNTLDVIHAVKERIAELQQALPADFKVSYTRDQSLFIEESFKAVQEHLILGGVCASLIVLFFIRNWRSTLIAAVAIPTSIISTYTLMNLMGFTLNQITMLALTLVVGIVIDDAIVVLENVFRFAEEKGLSAMEAARRGTSDIALAVLATTLSLVIIFVPVALMGGIVGRFMSSFGYTAAFAIMVSMFVSFSLTPMLCSRFLKVTPGESSTKETPLFRVMDRAYRVLLRWTMNHRWVLVAASIGVLLSTGPLFNRIGKDFLPIDDQSEFEISVRMPVGSSLAGTESAIAEVESEVRKLPGVSHILTTIGADPQRRVDRGFISVEMFPVTERKVTQQQVMLMAREKLRRFRDMTIGVQLPSVIQGTGTNQDFQFFLQGPELALLDRYSREIRRKLAEVPGVTDLDSSYEPGKPELRASINRERAADLRVPAASVATALRTLVGGDDQVTTYREGDDRYDVQLRVAKPFRTSPDALARLFVPSGTIGNTPLASVATLSEAAGPTQIERYNRQRQILITANLVKGQSLSNVLEVLNKTVEDLRMPPEYSAGLFGRSKEFGRAAKSYVLAFVLSIVFMYMVLAAQFESFIDPITILISLPLSAPFALLSLVLTGENFSIIYTSVGILILFGIVKKNAILQIDHIKSLRREGTPRLEAIIRGCEDRLRPIMMTTAALVAGMIPLALGGGAGAGSRRTVAIVVIGGQTLCLLLTLLVTPVAYSLFDDLAHVRWASFANAKLRRALGMLACAIAILAAPVSAQTPRVGVSMTQRKLGLSEAIEAALGANLEIEIERTNRAAAAESIRGAHGAFDPSLRWLPALESRNTPTGSVLQGSGGKLAEHFHSQNFYFRQRTPWSGLQLNADFENNRASSSNPFATLSPFTTSRLALGFTQPLLRNRLTDETRSGIRIRRKQLDLSQDELELRAIEVVVRVEQTYWDLAAARQDVGVKADTVEWAREQLARNKRLIAAGTLAPVELSASEAELQRRLDAWYSALGAVTEIENALKVLIAGGRGEEIWGDEIVPTSVRAGDVGGDDLREAVAAAIKSRVELRRTANRAGVNEVQKAQALDQTRPQVNLVASFASSGLGGAVRPGENPFTASTAALYDRVNRLSSQAGLAPLTAAGFGSLPETLLGGYGAALGNVFSGRYQTAQAGLTFDFTLRNRAAESALAQAAVTERRLKLERAQLEQAIEAQVRNAMQSIETARQRIAAAAAGERAAKDKLESEERLFLTGESTNFLVLTRQNEFADARRRRVAADLELNKAVSRLHHATGSTLASHRVSLK